jgi:hypothetical protein
MAVFITVSRNFVLLIVELSLSGLGDISRVMGRPWRIGALYTTILRSKIKQTIMSRLIYCYILWQYMFRS